jgi:hypothetical protein
LSTKNISASCSALCIFSCRSVSAVCVKIYVGSEL